MSRSDIEGTEKNYGTDVEQHIYRIIQEACENALRHGKSTTITISGRFENDSMDLFIEDNGIGFSTLEELGLDNLILEKHFGLAGMLERAMMLNAELKINSIPGKGAQIHIMWRAGL
jgi:two-component system sensor histidine kinase DegS